jgi:hypothetical protein
MDVWPAVVIGGLILWVLSVAMQAADSARQAEKMALEAINRARAIEDKIETLKYEMHQMMSILPDQAAAETIKLLRIRPGEPWDAP